MRLQKAIDDLRSLVLYHSLPFRSYGHSSHNPFLQKELCCNFPQFLNRKKHYVLRGFGGDFC